MTPENSEATDVSENVETPSENRVVESEESYDLYDGVDDIGDGIIDNPSIHIYIAHQHMDTETEGEQYVAPASSGSAMQADSSSAEDDTAENTEDTEDGEDSEDTET